MPIRIVHIECTYPHQICPLQYTSFPSNQQGLILDSLVPVFSFSAFPALAIKAGFTALVGFVTVQVYAVVTVNDKY